MMSLLAYALRAQSLYVMSQNNPSRLAIHLLLLILAQSVLSSCSLPKGMVEHGKASSSSYNRYAPKSFLSDNFPRPIKGTFTVSTHSLYTAPDFVERPRQRAAQTVIITYLEKAGLKFVPNGSQADYQVYYYYMSNSEGPSAIPPYTSMGFTHQMHITISKSAAPLDIVWKGMAEVPFCDNSDIGPSIVVLASMLTNKFPDVEYRYEGHKK